jgi:hypothetical protein
VLVTGGRVQADAGSPFLASSRAWVFRLSDAGFLEDPAQAEVDPLLTARAGATLTRLDDERGLVLVAGGEDDAGAPVGASELFVPSIGAFLPGPAMEHPRSRHVALRMGGFVVIAGGFGAGGAPVPQIEIYDTLRGEFYDSSEELPEEAGFTGASATLLADGTALLSGGTDAQDPRAPSALTFLIQLDAGGVLTLDRISDLVVARTGHGATLLCDGTVLVVGGAIGDENASERFNPRASGRRR